MKERINHYFEEIGGWPRDAQKLARSYVIGFVFSLFLIFIAYETVVQHMLSGNALILVLISLAGIQFIVQVICFLHLDRSSVSRERLLALVSIIVIVLILVLGSIWIMSHLNRRMMADPNSMEHYMNEQPGI